MDKDNDEYGQLAERQTKALVESMKQTLEDVCNRVKGFKDLTQLQQDFVKQMAVANVTAHFGGFNKKESNGG